MGVINLKECRSNEEIIELIERKQATESIKTIKVTFVEQETRHLPGVGELVGIYKDQVPFPFIIYVDKKNSSPALEVGNQRPSHAMDLFYSNEVLFEKGLMTKDHVGRNTLVDSHVIDAREIETLEFIPYANRFNKYVLDKGNM